MNVPIDTLYAKPVIALTTSALINGLVAIYENS